MPKENMTNSSNNLLPNGRNKEEYLRECHDFIETFHQKLMGYALHHERGDQDRAHDLLYDTFRVLLEGRDCIDFTRAPCKYFNMMMSRSRWKRKKQVDFEKAFLLDEYVADASGADKGDPEQFNEWNAAQREDTTFLDLADQLPQLSIQLTDLEKRHLDWYLDGLSTQEIQKKHKVSGERVRYIRRNFMKKIKKASEALLQDAE